MTPGNHGLTIPRLAEVLGSDLRSKEIGHCVRVDYLSRIDAIAACSALQALGIHDLEALVIAREPADAREADVDRAVELRNAKSCRLCVFIPIGFSEAASSSLANAFSPFDLKGFLKAFAEELRDQLPSSLRDYVTEMRRRFRGLLRPQVEEEIDYYAALVDDPSAEVAGRELWRVGLVPELGSTLDTARLELNCSAVGKLVRPPKADSSVEDRVASLGLAAGSIQAELVRFLRGKSLHGRREWFSELLLPHYAGRLTFEQWRFPDVEKSDLVEIALDAFTDEHAAVVPRSELRQPGGPGTEIYADCGPRKKVRVKWSTTPKRPQNVSRWRVALIPATTGTHDDDAASSLPSRDVKPTQSTATISLDIDLSAIDARIVQARVSALGADGMEIRAGEEGSAEHEVIEGLSEPFHLVAAVPEDDYGPVEQPRFRPVRSVAEARLQVALRPQSFESQDLSDTSAEWVEGPQPYLQVRVGRLATFGIPMSGILRDLQSEILGNPSRACIYEAEASGVELLKMAAVRERSIDPGPVLQPKWDEFLRMRARCFNALNRQKQAGCVEGLRLDGAAAGTVKDYARAFASFLDSARVAIKEAGDNAVPVLEGLSEALQVDTLRLRFDRSGESLQCAVVVPTHPLRLLWYTAYAELLDSWCTALADLRTSEKRQQVSEASLEQLQPFNLPAFLPMGRGETFMFAANLGLFHGLYIPPSVQEPAGVISDAARLVGFGAPQVLEATLPPGRVVDRIRRYLDMHQYVGCLRINALNPGGGEFIRQVFEGLFSESQDDDDDVQRAVPLLDITAQSDAGAQYPAPGLSALVRRLRELHRTERGWHLAPTVQLARRPAPDPDGLPGQDVHIALCLDQFVPSLELASAQSPRMSASAYGLLTRFVSSFSAIDDIAVWTYKVSLGGELRIDRHPVSRAYTDTLIAVHDQFLRLSACIQSWSNRSDSVPALRLELTPERRSLLNLLHTQSDWVMFVDRHFGIEYFDNPGDPYLEAQANRYLLDYVPEYVEGIGHRLMVTTAWQEEVSDVLRRALDELGFGSDADTIRYLLDALKAISGRLAFRLLDDSNHAKEAVSLAVAVAYLREHGRLKDAILLPVDPHTSLLDTARRSSAQVASLERCDLIVVELNKRQVKCRFIEVKYRTAAGSPSSQALLDRIVEQTGNTETAFRELFFPEEKRADHAVMRCRLASILQFYLDRALRHGFIEDRRRYHELSGWISDLEADGSRFRSERAGYIVTPSATEASTMTYEQCEVTVIGAPQVNELRQAPLYVAEEPTTSMPDPEEVDVIDAAETQPEVAPAPTPRKATTQSARPGAIVVPLGLSAASGEEVRWAASTAGSPHLFILGITGQGKSWTILRLLSQASKQVPILVLDFHGEYAHGDTPFAQMASPQIIDVSAGLPFSPLEATNRREDGAAYWRLNSLAVAEIVEYVCGLGEIQKDLLYRAVRDTYQAAGYADSGPTRPAPSACPTIGQVMERLEELESRPGSARNVVARCRPLFEFGLFRSAPAGAVPFAEVVRQPTVLDLHSVGHQTLQNAAGAFVLRKLYKDMFGWGETDALRLLVVLDEAHRLARDITLPLLMKEGRKFGVALVLASQSPADFHRDVIGNAGARVVFRMNYPESRQAAKFLTPRDPKLDLASRIEQLRPGQAYVQTVEGYQGRVSMYPYGDALSE